MARVKRGVHAAKKRRTTLERASGYTGQRSRLFSRAKEQVTHSMVYAFNDRKDKKGQFRRLWITRINAAARANNMTYNRFMQGLKVAGIDVDRRVLADMAINDPAAFKSKFLKMVEAKKAKPDFLDLDKDGNTKETMKKAAADKKKSVEGSKLTESAYNSAKAGLQRTVDFAKKRGYVIRKSPTSKAVIFFNKDIGHKLAAIVDNDGSSINVNFKDYSSGMSGNDDASYFDKTLPLTVDPPCVSTAI